MYILKKLRISETEFILQTYTHFIPGQLGKIVLKRFFDEHRILETKIEIIQFVTSEGIHNTQRTGSKVKVFTWVKKIKLQLRQWGDSNIHLLNHLLTSI